MQMKPTLALACVLIAVSSAVAAQAPPTPATPPARTAPPAPDRAAGCAAAQTTPQGSIAPEGTTAGQAPAPWGDRRGQSDGVLCPPAGVDPQMHAPTPETGSGSMPVIPPPGSPG